MKNLGLALALTSEAVISSLLAFGVGYWIDNKFEINSHIASILGVTLGFGFGIFRLIKGYNRFFGNDE